MYCFSSNSCLHPLLFVNDEIETDCTNYVTQPPYCNGEEVSTGCQANKKNEITSNYWDLATKANAMEV